MIAIDLLEFLRTGAFGSVALGATQSDVIEHLGEPDDVVLRGKAATPHAFCYGVFELYFDPDRRYQLVSVFADHFDTLIGGPRLEVDPWILHGGVAMRLIESALQQQQIGFAAVRPPDPRLRGLRMQSGVELWFDERDSADAHWGLRVVRIDAPAESTERERQISLSIPIAEYRQLRLEAQRQQISVARLCRRWLLERAALVPKDDA